MIYLLIALLIDALVPCACSIVSLVPGYVFNFFVSLVDLDNGRNPEMWGCFVIVSSVS